MELKHYIALFWKWLWLILLSTGIAAGASYYVTSEQPRIYQATAKLLVGQSIASPDPNGNDIATSQLLALTYIQIAKTTPVLQGTIDALGLQMTTGGLDSITNASVIQGTQLIQISVVDVDPARAQALANELAHQLTLQGPAAAEQEQAKSRDFVRSQAQDLQSKIESGQKRIAELESSVQVTASASEIADIQQQTATLGAQITQWQQSYAALITTLAPTSPNYLSVLELAGLPLNPIAPNVFESVLVASAIGFILAVSGAFLIEYFDDSLKNPDEITKFLQLPTIASIARIKGAEGQKLVASLAPRSAIAEAYRMLRTNIQFSNVDRPSKSILVTSPGTGEGKSITAANLAIVFAQTGLRTILVDADLRKPAQHGLFGLTNETGLMSGLISQTASENFVRETGVVNLRVVTSGPLPPNPAEVLGSERMRALKRQLETEADMLVLDSPPCLPLTDAAILATLVDGVVIVVDATHTRREMAVRSKELLEKVGGHTLGVVLNRIHPRSSGYYYNYYSYDGKEVRKRESKSPVHPAVLPGGQRG